MAIAAKSIQSLTGSTVMANDETEDETSDETYNVILEKMGRLSLEGLCYAPTPQQRRIYRESELQNMRRAKTTHEWDGIADEKEIEKAAAATDKPETAMTVEPEPRESRKRAEPEAGFDEYGSVAMWECGTCQLMNAFYLTHCNGCDDFYENRIVRTDDADCKSDCATHGSHR